MAHQGGRDGIETPPEREPTPSAAPLAAAGGHTVGIRRIGTAVQITLTSANEYTSIELYDSLIQSVEKGHLRLELKLPRS